MKILQVNTVYRHGSTGNIVSQLYQAAELQKWKCIVAYRYAEPEEVYSDTYQVSSWLDCHIHNRISKYTTLQGCFSYFKTRIFLMRVEKFNPDIIHLHNIHGSFINHSLLFSFIKKHALPIVWTLHDCWAFTGQCPHFTIAKCDKWKTGCHHCPNYRLYPEAYVDCTKMMWRLKKKWFSGVQDMTIVTPSQWLADLVKQSFLKDYPIRLIHNGIDLNVFKPTASTFRERFHIQDKLIVLGVSFGWGRRKGLDVFVTLAQRLDECYQIVLVGTDDIVDKLLPDTIISIHCTENQNELAEIYSSADVFVNPTREEVLGLVNIEALACGTPIVTFDTGGSPEVINETCGSVVACDDLDAMEEEIKRICKTKPYSEAACLARAKLFDKNTKFEEYINLYQTRTDEK